MLGKILNANGWKHGNNKKVDSGLILRNIKSMLMENYITKNLKPF